MKRSVLPFLAIAALLAPVAQAADQDVTGLVPTIWFDFETKPDAAGLATANKGSASISFSNKGTAAYGAGVTNGWALNTVGFSPYSASGGRYSSNANAFTVSAVMTLGTTANGITLNVRCETAQKDLIIRRGATSGSLVIGLGTQKAASTKFLNATVEDGDTAYHLVSVVAEQSGTSLYVDGDLVDATTDFTLWHASGCASRMQFGERLSSNQSGETAYGGLIDDLRIHDAALTSAQMKAIAIECGVMMGDSISVSAAGEPEIGKDSFSVPWRLSIGGDFSANAAIVHGADAALSTPTTNAMGSALTAGNYTASLSNLASGTTYWWKIVASNGVNWAETPVASFHTLDVVVANNFEKRIPITVSGYAGASNLTNFPVLVKLSADSPAGFDYADCAADGADLRFADADGILMPHEIDSWDPTGTSYIWVRVPLISGTDTQFTLYYGADPAGLPAVAPSDVWSRYVVVIHGGAALTNAVDNGLAVTAGSASVTANAIVGEIGGGISKSTANAIGLNVTNPSSVLSDSGKFSVSGWFRRSGNGGNNGNGTHILVGGRSNWSSPNGFLVLQEQGKYISVAYAGGHNWSSGDYVLENQTWGHVAFAYKSGSSLASYFNGNPDQTKSNPTTLVNATEPYWTFGSYGNRASSDSFVGDMDELRVLDGVASADWIKAEYDSVADPASFAVCGAVESTDDAAPVFGTCGVTVSDNDATFSVQIESLAAPAAVSVFYRAEDAASLTELSLGTVTATGTAATATVSDLDVGTYIWYARAVSTIGGTDHAATTAHHTFAVTHAKELSSTYKRITATIGYEGAAAANVPVLLRLSESIDGFRYADVTESGFEILDENGNLIPYEIDTWDTNGVSLVWVTVPSFSHGAELTIRYGTTFVNPPLAASGVWAGYVGVWHLNDTNSASAYGSYPNSTAAVGIDGQKAQASIADEEGLFGKSVKICDAGANTGEFKKGGVFVPDSGVASPLDLDGTFMISGWFKHKNQNYYYDHIFYKRQKSNDGSGSPTGAFAIEMSGASTSDTKIDARGTQDSGAAMALPATMKNAWAYLTFVYNGTTLSVYQNGAPVKSQTISKATDNNAPLAFGNNATALPDCLTADGDCCWCGWIDEVRLSDGVPSADWIAAEYAAMTDASVVSFGRVSTIDATSPGLATPTAERNQDGSFTVSVVVSGNAPASIFCNIGGTDYPMATTDASLPMTYSATLSSLADGTYTALVCAESTMGNEVYSAFSTTFHVGALAVEVISNADEGSLAPGVFRVSRLDADPTGLPALTFDVAFSGDGLAAVIPPAVAALTIPAGESSVDVSVTPIHTTDVNVDTEIVLTASGTNIGQPSSNTMAVVNADYDIAVRYVATTGDDNNHGGTPELPKKTIASAVSSLSNVALSQTCTVHVAEGQYSISKQLQLTQPIRLVGDGADPSRVVVSNTKTPDWNNKYCRCLLVNHASAWISGMTFENGKSYYSGGNVQIDANGGVVSNCVIKGGFSRESNTATGANATILGPGTISHCRIVGGYMDSNGASSAKICSVSVQHAQARIENCLIDGFAIPASTANGGSGLLVEKGTAVNCTVVNTQYNVEDTDKQAKFAGIKVTGSGVAINCVSALNADLSGTLRAFLPEQTGSCLVNCAFDAIAGAGDALSGMVSPVNGTAARFFKNFARSDYRPRTGGPLVGVGENYSGMADVDLTGTHKRLVGRIIDIGAYEGDPEMTIFIVK